MSRNWVRNIVSFGLLIAVFFGMIGFCMAEEFFKYGFKLIKESEHEKVYEVTVNPRVKPFEVHLIFNNIDKKVLEKLDIYRGSNLLQSFTPPEDIEMASENAALLETELVIEDVDYDGYGDLKLSTRNGWSLLYNPKKDRFEEEAEPLTLIETTEHGRTYSLFVNRNVKPLTIKVFITKSSKEDDKVKIEIFRGRRLFQTLTTEMMSPPDNTEILFSDDMNFDCYNDLELMASWSPMGNDCYSYWLYNPQKDRFEYSKALNSLCNPWPDEDRKILTTYLKGGGWDYTLQAYRWQRKKLVLIRDVHQYFDDKKNQYHKIIKKLQDGKMVRSDRYLSREEAQEENHKGTQPEF